MCAAVQQCEDEHPYALHTYLLEELNKMGIAYVRRMPCMCRPALCVMVSTAHADPVCLQVHFIEPRALHSMGVASPNAEFNFERRDQTLDVRCCSCG